MIRLTLLAALLRKEIAMTKNILVVEDDFALRSALIASLEISGYTVHSCENAETAIMLYGKTALLDLILTDIQMGEMSGIDLLRYIREKNTRLPVILMTAHGDITDAVEAMKIGACDYIQKPFEPNELTKIIDGYLRDVCDDTVVIEDPVSAQIYEYAEKIATTDSNVLLSGNSGAGKEVMAKFIHQRSTRGEQNFVAINCAAIPENMLESTLFGYEKGAFTGAHQTSIGKFEQAQNGTLLLDEISEMPLSLQAKLLRVIQEKEVERLGGKKTIKLNVRIIATTNRDLKEEVKLKHFREDLYYRLNVFPIQCPDLTQRPGDIFPLAEKFLKKYRVNSHLKFSAEAKAKLISYSWPGNVRELDNLIQRVVVLSSSESILAEDITFEGQVFSGELSQSQTNTASKESEGEEGLLGSGMQQHEYQLIIESLAKCQGKKKLVAETLGISARTLRYKLAKMRDAGYCIPDKKSFA
jgi:two-component system response regulator FlrC